MNDFKLTTEQENIIDFVCSKNKSLVVNAYAGASKSTTSSFVVKQFKKGKVLYTTFGNKNVVEAKAKFGEYADCITNYGLAFRAVGKFYMDNNRLPEIYPIEIVHKKLKLKDISYDNFKLNKISQAYDILRTIVNYCYTSDIYLTLDHVNLDILENTTFSKSNNYFVYKSHIFNNAKIIWEYMLDKKNDIPITHDIYVKIWALSNPDLSFYNLIIGDEYQDVNPVFSSIIKNQPVQKLILGDKYQSLYEWRGSVNSLNLMGINDKLYLSKSFRFGQDIADLANKIIKFQIDEDVNIQGFEKKKTEIHTTYIELSNFTVLCRTNAICLKYLLEAHINNKKVKFIGDTGKMIKYINGIMALRSGKQAFGALSIFKNYRELLEYANSKFGGEIKTLINILNDCKQKDITVEQLKLILLNSKNTKKPDIIISTAHATKGLEFKNVILANDFRSHKEEDFELQDCNLLYTAATRAINSLDVSRCSTIKEILR